MYILKQLREQTYFGLKLLSLIIKTTIHNITSQTKNALQIQMKVNPNESNDAIQVDNKSLRLTPKISFRVNF